MLEQNISHLSTLQIPDILSTASKTERYVQESANSVYRRCAEEFGFKIAEVDGRVYSTASELYQPLGYSQPRNVSNVLRRNNIETISSRQIDASLMQAELSLPKMDYSTRLIDYRGFLAVAIQGLRPLGEKKIERNRI